MNRVKYCGRAVSRIAANDLLVLLRDADLFFDRFNVQFVQPRREIDPDGVKVIAALLHLFNGVLLAPSLNRNAINRTHDPGPVCAMLAMKKDGIALFIGDELQEFDNFLTLRMPGFHKDVLAEDAGVANFITVRIERA